MGAASLVGHDRADSTRPPSARARRPSRSPNAALCARHGLLDASVAERKEQAYDRAVDEQRRAAIAHQRQGDSSQRHDAEIAAGDDRGLDDDDQRQACREQRAEVVNGKCCDAEAALGDDQVEAQERERAEHAQLLRDAGKDEVGVDRRN